MGWDGDPWPQLDFLTREYIGRGLNCRLPSGRGLQDLFFFSPVEQGQGLVTFPNQRNPLSVNCIGPGSLNGILLYGGKEYSGLKGTQGVEIAAQ